MLRAVAFGSRLLPTRPVKDFHLQSSAHAGHTKKGLAVVHLGAETGSGDGCRRDEDGDYWVTGRVDDVINVSGHRMGTAEIESALVAHAKVAESAVVGYPHTIKGQGIYAYVTLMGGEEPSDALRKELETWVRTEIGPIAKPDLIQWAPGLPKTRSGKIMRRILRKIAEDDFGSLGDTSTLADPSVVDDLIGNRMNRTDA